jgi:predicted nucleic acid-binding protein
MNGNCFIDTNILVYCYTDDEQLKQKKALDIANNSDTFISIQVLTELSNTLKKKFKLDW